MLRHLIELRQRALCVFILFALLFFLFFFLTPNLFQSLMRPLLQALSIHEHLIVTQITAPLFVSIKLASDAALLCTAPFALLQTWRFVVPGLYQHERFLLRWAMVGSVMLFFIGSLFCFYMVLPSMFLFFAHAVPDGVQLMPDMASAVDFITRMLLVFGFCFQIPLVCLILVRLQILDIARLKMIRPYMIVAAFTLGMLLTPPDVLSQIMLAVPLCLLYESGIFVAMILHKRQHRRSP